MGTIPETARQLIEDYGFDLGVLEGAIVAALQAVDTAAEKRGEERERERCARIVDEIGSALMDRTPAEAAKAIRGA